MLELYLMRHAKAKRAQGGMADHQRPLRKRGRRQAAAMAHALQRWQALEGEIHVSDAARTRETLDEIAKQLSEPSLVERACFDEALYTFDAQALLAWLKALPDEVERVLVIGHNPALLELARWLCAEAPSELTTGSLLHLSLPDTPWQSLEHHAAENVNCLTPEQASHALFKRKAPAKPSLHKASLAKRIRGQLEHQYLMVRVLEPGVAAGIDPEFLHQYRVNLRRSRAIGQSVWAAIKVPGLKKRLKHLKHRAQATSDLRDLDVFLESLSEAPPPLTSYSCQALERWLLNRRDEEHAALCQQLVTPDYAEEMQAWRDFISSGNFRKILRKLSSERIEAVLAERIARHDSDLAALSSDSPDAAFHELRKVVKRIRYLAELDPKRHRTFLSKLKRRQSLLGDIQDLCTRQAWIEAFSASSRNAPRRVQECAAWRGALEKQKHSLREDVVALAPLTDVY
ncbi:MULTISPECIES: CHAD domain-containing protein [Halomonas]|uniref:Phosphohistidine phosphatase n=1 Tax=Halomonas ventosae TaxID=229007 RepID=A0A4V3BY66_9GAMM|nr:CHAD domain-containing protein [Halomonas ventosae]TDO01459.1 phosphohistidine phosphatase [Halomonas ventosae]